MQSENNENINMTSIVKQQTLDLNNIEKKIMQKNNLNYKINEN